MFLNPTVKGEINGVPYEVVDLRLMNQPGFIPGFYYAAGDNEETEESGLETISVEGPYATAIEAEDAAKAFITLALSEREPI